MISSISRQRLQHLFRDTAGRQTLSTHTPRRARTSPPHPPPRHVHRQRVDKDSQREREIEQRRTIQSRCHTPGGPFLVASTHSMGVMSPRGVDTLVTSSPFSPSPPSTEGPRTSGFFARSHEIRKAHCPAVCSRVTQNNSRRPRLVSRTCD